jgi:hypothetical protein
LVVKFLWKREFKKTGDRRQDSIKIDLEEVWYEGVDCGLNSAQNRILCRPFVSMVLYLWVP